MRTSKLSVVLLIVISASACSNERRVYVTSDAGPNVDSGGGDHDMSSTPFDLGPLFDAGIPDVGPNPDAYFAMDPPPMACLPDGGMGTPVDPPGGTPDCPDDKNREGCRCTNVGETAPCWPGLRVDRDRGICHDGMTTCEAYDEFSGTWGACRGAVLPVEGARIGPNACNCFSAGQWEIDNLAPCFITYSDGVGPGQVHAVSTLAAGGCPADPGGPPPTPVGPWSANRLNVDCQGHFRLCYTLKAGNSMTASPSDCVVARVCVEDWYETSGATQEFPVLPGWPNADSPANQTCAAAFAATGGYGEMSVTGLSIECDPIDDGEGGEYVFNRVQYCPADCADRPTDADCMSCSAGGSGSF